MAWFGRRKAAKQRPEPFDYAFDVRDRWIALPDPGERIDVADWARETVALFAPNFEDAETMTPADLDKVGAQLAAWAQMHMASGPADWGLVLVVEASFGLEAYATVRAAEFDSSFARAEDVEHYDVHSAPLLGERFTEMADFPAGRAGHAFSVREGSFGGSEAQVRNDEWFVCVEPEHMVLVFHAEWISPGADDMVSWSLRQMVETLKITSPRPEVSAPSARVAD